MLLIIILVLLILGFGYGGYRVGPDGATTEAAASVSS
jgi:type VI protein secretion system component VasF